MEVPKSAPIKIQILAQDCLLCSAIVSGQSLRLVTTILRGLAGSSFGQCRDEIFRTGSKNESIDCAYIIKILWPQSQKILSGLNICSVVFHHLLNGSAKK